MNTIANNNKTEKPRAFWIDIAKALAIIAVITDHTYSYLYNNKMVQMYTFFSVSLFIICMAVTTYGSLNRPGATSIKYVKKRCVSILIPYLIGTILYIYYSNRYLDLYTCVDKLIHFNAAPPFYYVLLYVQLVVIAPVFYGYITRLCVGKKIIPFALAGGVITFLVSYELNNHTNILGIYGGGGKMFGGSFLLLLYFGLLMAHLITIYGPLGNTWNIVGTVSFGGLLVAILVYMGKCGLGLDNYFPLVVSVNPPGATLITYSSIIACFLFFVESLLGKTRAYVIVGRALSVIGRNTLGIFIYHILMISILNDIVGEKLGITIGNIWLRRILWYCVIICGSMIVDRIVKKIQYLVRWFWVNEPCDDEVTGTR